MPYEISENDGEFWVQNKQTGRRMHKRPYHTKKEALRLLGALEANVNDAKSVKHDGYHSTAEKDKLQAIHDHAAAMGADCAGMGEAESKAVKAVKYMLDMGMDADAGEAYARQELADINSASYVLQSLCSLMMDELTEPEDRAEILDLMRGVMAFISGEIDQMEQSAGGEPPAKHTIEVKSDPDGDFLVVDKDGQHLRVKRNGKPDHGLMGGAWAALHEGYRGNKYEGADKEAAIAKLKKLYSAEGMDVPDEKKSLNFSYAKSLGIQIPDLAVKYVGKDAIKSYTFLWGSPKLTDVEIEYFTPETDFWDESQKNTRWLTWDHGQDESFKADTRIGQIVDYGDDEIGRWYEAKLDRSHKYRKMIDRLIEQGALGTSSDSAPQYVVREKTGKATWLKQWPWFASALTDVPCEPRMIGSIEVLKSMGIVLPDELPNAAREIEYLALRERELRLRNPINTGGR